MIISPSSLILSSPPWIPVSSQVSPFYFHTLISKFYSITLPLWPTAFSQGVGTKLYPGASVTPVSTSLKAVTSPPAVLSSSRWTNPFLTYHGLFTGSVLSWCCTHSQGSCEFMSVWPCPIHRTTDHHTPPYHLAFTVPWYYVHWSLPSLQGGGGCGDGGAGGVFKVSLQH